MTAGRIRTPPERGRRLRPTPDLREAGREQENVREFDRSSRVAAEPGADFAGVLFAGLVVAIPATHRHGRG